MAKHILIIGDNAPTLAMISALLTYAGYTVTTQTHATYALGYTYCTNAMLIVIDRTLGDEITIWQTVQALRLDRITTHLPLIICTNLGPNKQETHFYRERHILFVLKPFEDGRLLAAVNASLPDSQKNPVVPQYANSWR